MFGLVPLIPTSLGDLASPCLELFISDVIANRCDPMSGNADQVKNAATACKIRPEGIRVPIIWNPPLVVISILVAIFGSFTALGLVIWAMHFIGMPAFHMPVPLFRTVRPG